MNKTSKLATGIGTFLVTLLLAAGSARAATVQYMLDQSNTLEDDIDYLLVTISDDQAGQLDFLVEPQATLTEIAGENFGIASFGFLLDAAVELHNDDFLLPEKWKVQFNKGMSEAGKFDVRIMGTGQTRQDPLAFSVLGLSLDDIIAGFASHTAGFHIDEFGHEGEGYDDEHHEGRRYPPDGISSAFFYGSRPVTTVVPLPAAAWLFGSGLLLLGGFSARRQR